MNALRSMVFILAAMAPIAACTSDPAPGALLGFADEPAGGNCAAGGTRVDAGRDDDGDGVLDAAEIDTTTYVCDGNDGTDGTNGVDGVDGTDGVDGVDGTGVLIRVTPEVPGANCASGGHRVDTGVDADHDGVLAVGEISATAYVCDGEDGGPAVAGFRLVSRFTLPTGPVAEIIAPSPDGRTLAYTSGGAGTVGFVDLTNPSAPVALGQVDVAGTVTNNSGEPTSVAITPDGTYALVTVKDTTDPIGRADAGALVFIAMATRTIVATVPIGVGPDSLHLTPDGTRAVIAIEDEENPDGNAVAQARPGSVQIVTIDPIAPASSTVATIALTPTGGNLPTDPQPEYVDITPDGTTAVVSLQENNLIAVIDLTTSTVVRYIDAGSSIHARADVLANATTDFTSAFVGQLQPDAACLFAGGSHFVTANEGDTPNNAFGAGVWAGGRGFSVFRLDGTRVYDSGDALEWFALRGGAYPEPRSGNRGVEPEGCATGVFGGAEYAFITGERDASLFVIDVTAPATPVLRQLLGAPMRPESVVALPARDLVVVGGEGNGIGGGVWIYQAVTDAADVGNGLDVYDARTDAVPFSSLGALAHDPATGLILATPDNAVAGQRIWSFWVDHVSHRMQLVSELRLRDAAGAPLVGYDPEGLALNPAGGYVLATEGVAGNGATAPCVGSVASNRLLFVDAAGRLDATYGTGGVVDLPCGAAAGAIDWTTVRANGFEGVAAIDTTPGVAGGLRVYVAMQRGLTTEGQLARIGEYAPATGAWRWFFYPLDADLGGAAGAQFLSELLHVGGDKFAVIERDQGWAGAATTKAVRVFRLGSGTAGASVDPLDKVTAVDLLAHRFRFDQEKIEGLALGAGGLWVTNDNDGGLSPTYFLKLDPAVLAAEVTTAPTPGQDVVVINEVNSAADYVELWNRGTAAVDVGGWRLTDGDPTHVTTLPLATTIAAGGRLLIDASTSAAPVRLGFALDAADAIALFTPTGTEVGRYTWTAEVAAASRCPDGAGAVFWAPTPPTPGAANDCTPPTVPGQATIKLNEVNSSGTDFVELINTGATAIDLGGWRITDNDPTHVLVLPAGTTIGAGARLLIEGDTSTASLRLTFGLGSNDAATLATPYDVRVDLHSWTAHVASASRCPEGTGGFVATAPTPGAANACP